MRCHGPRLPRSTSRHSPGRNVPARAASEPHGLGTTTTNKRERSNHRRHREAAVAPAGHRAGSGAGPVWSWGHSRSSRLHCRRPRREPARCRVLPLRTLARPSLDLRRRQQRRHMQPARAAIQRSKKYNISSSHPLYVIGCVGERVTIGSGSQRSATAVPSAGSARTTLHVAHKTHKSPTSLMD